MMTGRAVGGRGGPVANLGGIMSRVGSLTGSLTFAMLASHWIQPRSPTTAYRPSGLRSAIRKQIGEQMKRKTSMTSALLVGLLALTAASASADKFNSMKVIKGESTGPQVWSIGEDTLKCAKATFEGVGHNGPSAAISANPTYAECEAKFGGISTKEIEFEKYGISFGELEGTSPEFKAKVVTKNPAGGGQEEGEGEKVKPVEVHIFIKVGLIKIKIWTIIGYLPTVNIKNTDTEKGHYAAEASVELKKVPYTSNGEGGVPKSGENLEFKGGLRETGAIAE
jgi:hypothetical protein